MSRRTLVQGLAVGVGATVVGVSVALAQSGPAAPPSTVTTPPRDFSPRGAPTTYFWDPDIIAVDPSFNDLAQPNTAIKRLYTGLLWAEGPAWSSQGRYLLWSDIPNNRQMRWSEDDGHVSVFRTPSNNSNGNSFDFQGRQLSCEHLTRRVVRYEHVQLADNRGRNEPGTGEINYPFLFRHLDAIGYRGWVGCEYKPRTTTVDGLGWHAAQIFET